MIHFITCVTGGHTIQHYLNVPIDLTCAADVQPQQHLHHKLALEHLLLNGVPAQAVLHLESGSRGSSPAEQHAAHVIRAERLLPLVLAVPA